MILYFATILLAVNSVITIVSSQDTSGTCFDAYSELLANRGCYNALRSLANSNDTNYEPSLNNEDVLQAYCSSSCRSIIIRINQFCVSCT